MTLPELAFTCDTSEALIAPLTVVSVRKFDALYADVAKVHKASLVPFFFEGFGERNELFQPDRIHPTAQAQSRLLDNVWPQLVPLLKR